MTTDRRYVEAGYGVPHTKFQETPNGFTVRFRKENEKIFKMYRHMGDHSSSDSIFAAFFYLIFNLILLLVSLLMFFVNLMSPTTILVDKDAVTIDGKKLARSDFGSFSVHHTLRAGEDDTRAVLGYSYGRRSFPFGGVWKHDQAEEVASALNIHLKSTPRAQDDARASAEKLRNVRPTDF